MCSVLCVASTTFAQPAYPVKPIRLIVGFAPGGGTDILARAMAQPLGELLGQQVTIDNRAGAGGIIATELGARAAPDGYTLLVGSSAGFAINPNLMAKLPYDPVRDFTPVGMFATLSYAVDVHPSLPAKTLRDLIALARAKPGAINYGSAGQGSSTHLAIEQFAQMSGIKLTHIPYKGNTPAMTALMSGEVAMVFDPVLTSVPMIRSGRVRALAVSTAKRSALLPEVPTIAEAGVKGYEAGNWFGVFAPAGTPREIVERLNTAINRTMTRPEMKDKLVSQGADALTGTPAELAALVQRELAKFAAIIKAAGVRVE
ncbi:MAG: tripartite tricarboxylate transporter substrate binding protein [Burkholderiales bacterium]